MRNPKGENGSTKSWQREILLLRTLIALDELSEAESHRKVEALARSVPLFAKNAAKASPRNIPVFSITRVG